MSARAKIYDLIRYAVAAVWVAGLWACTKDPGVDRIDAAEAGVTLRLSTGASFTRGDDHYADDDYAERFEEAIGRVDLFFFGVDVDADDLPAVPEDGAKPFYVHEMTVGKTAMADISVKLPIELLEQFKTDRLNKRWAYVYALVNLPSEVTKAALTADDVTYSSLQQLWVRAPEFLTKAGPSSFVMRGGSMIEMLIESNTASAAGAILLERLASKIRLWAEIPASIYVNKETGRTVVEGDEEWENRDTNPDIERWESVPMTEGASNVLLYLYNLTTRGRIDAYLGTDDTRADLLGYESIDRREMHQDVVRRLESGDAVEAYFTAEQDLKNLEQYPYTHTLAYYSYPNEWDSSTPAEEHQTYVIIRLPWQRATEDGGMEFSNYYYQIPVNALRSSDGAEAERLEPNRYYRIKLRVGMLGSKDLGTPVELEASYEVVPWQTADVDVNIKDRRYLVVNQTAWTMNNVWTLEIPFSTSHKTVVEACYVNYFRYNDVWGTDNKTQGVHNVDEFTQWLAAADELPGRRSAGEDLITATYTTQYNSGNNRTYTEVKEDGQTVTVWVPGHWEGFDWVWGHNETFNVKGNYTVNVTSNIQNINDKLYYKPNYFYDPNYQTLENDGFRYYLGHEHPKTLNPDLVKYTDEQLAAMTPEEQYAWNLYREKYEMNALYTHEIDEEKGVIRFSHPLVQWKEVRKTQKTQETKEGTSQKRGGIYLQRGEYYQDYIRNDVDIYEGVLQYYVPELNPRTQNLWDEFSRCEIILKIRHEDWKGNDDLYRETIYITQYPGMYVEVSHDYGGLYESTSKRGNQYILINGNTTEDPTKNNWGRSTEWWEVTATMSYYGDVNNNPNMYVIHTTQLSEDNERLYDIGDPRTLYYNNLLDDDSFTDEKYRGKDVENSNNNWPSVRYYSGDERNHDQYDRYNVGIATADRISGGTGRLMYYYPTDEATGAGSKENFIAPSFRIASSFGKVSLVMNRNGDYPELELASRTEARRRCAAYQEGGRPAGRWRVPTVAEIRYLVYLSADGKIPHLFGLQSDPNSYIPYWSSGGILAVRLSDNDVKLLDVKELDMEPAVRCVYDDWYWTQIDGRNLPTEKGDLEDKFYWGDHKKDNTQVQTLVRSLANEK